MQINFTFIVALNGAVIVLGLFAAFSLFMRKKNGPANKLMSLFLLSISLWLVDNFMRISGIYNQDPDYYFKPIYYSFAFGPLLFFYVKKITNSEFKIKSLHILHFVPVILQGCLYLFLTFQSYDFKRWYWQEIHLPYTYRVEFDGSFISMAIYLFFSLRILTNYQKWLKDEFSEVSKSHLNWLKVIFILMLVLVVQWFIEVILRDFYSVYYNYSFSTDILGILTLILAYRAFHQEDQTGILFTSKKSEDSKNLDFKKEILERIEQRMEQNKDYLDPLLSLKAFASHCKLPQKVVSQYLNQKLNVSFHDFVNGYRVNEFKQRALLVSEKNMTLEGLAYDCGFNSKASFNRIFKKSTNQTPSEFVSKASKS